MRHDDVFDGLISLVKESIRIVAPDMSFNFGAIRIAICGVVGQAENPVCDG